MSITAPQGGILYGGAAIGDHLGLQLRQVYTQIANGRLPTFKLGKTVCATREALDLWVAERAAARSSP